MNKKKCPICDQGTDNIKTAIKSGVYISERCERCIANFTQVNIYARKHERNWQKRHYSKDLIQRFEGDKINPDFVDAYPEAAREQWGENISRDYGVKRKLL